MVLQTLLPKQQDVPSVFVRVVPPLDDPAVLVDGGEAAAAAAAPVAGKGLRAPERQRNKFLAEVIATQQQVIRSGEKF